MVRRNTTPSRAFGPAAELGCQACDLAQLLRHFLESLRRLLSSHLRIGDPAGKNGVPLALELLALTLLGLSLARPATRGGHIAGSHVAIVVDTSA